MLGCDWSESVNSCSHWSGECQDQNCSLVVASTVLSCGHKMLELRPWSDHTQEWVTLLAEMMMMMMGGSLRYVS